MRYDSLTLKQDKQLADSLDKLNAELSRISGIDCERHHRLALAVNYPLYKTIRVISFQEYALRFTVARMKRAYYVHLINFKRLLRK